MYLIRPEENTDKLSKHEDYVCMSVTSRRVRDGFLSQLCYEPVHVRTTYQPDLTTFPQPRHIPTRGYNITQSSAPDDGHMVARNMLSNY